MNRDQFNRTEMFSTVAAYMQTNSSLWSGIPALAQTVTEFNGKIASINAKMRNQQTPTGGVTEQKAQVRLNLEESILEIADQIAALAAQTHNMNLADQADLTLSILDRMTDDALEETGRRISALAVANAAALENYGVLGDDVTALNELITQFHNVKTGPRAAVAGRKGETDTLPGAISDATSLLRNRLDRQMTKFRRANPVFYAGYRTARVIVDRGGSGGAPPPAPTPPA